MERKRTYTFDEMPIIMAELMSKVENLTEKVDLLATEKRTQRPVQLEGKAMFVPSHRNTMNTKAVCKLLHVKPLAIYRMVSAGEIPYFKQGKSLGFFEDEIFTWLEKRKGQKKNITASWMKPLESIVCRITCDMVIRHILMLLSGYDTMPPI